MGRIAILTRGLWRLREEVGALTGLSPVFWAPWRRPAFEAVAGWGHKPTADRARQLAWQAGVPYVAFEDGPLRSVKPGPAQPPIGMVMDRGGIYYRADSGSDLVALAARADWFVPEIENRALQAVETLRRLRLSKYNSGPERTAEELRLPARRGQRILVLDQVHNDASISGALADAGSFDAMLNAALEDDPAADIVLKVHPDVLSGRRAGYFSQLRSSDRVTLVAEQVNPWSLLDAVDAVYTVSSGLGFEAVLGGKRVVTFGTPFYAGWGFTEDRNLKVARPVGISPLQLFAAYYFEYTHYFDAWSRHPIDFETAADQLAWLRDRFMEQDRRPVCYRITRWKRRTVDRMLDGPGGAPIHASDISDAVQLAKANGGQVVAWASRDTTSLEAACAKEGVELRRVEDGFIRSAGLGASFVQPSSLVFDGRGIFYDSRGPSDLEVMLEEAAFPPDLVERARFLREKLIAARTTKYNVTALPHGRIDAGGRPIVLVPGQVEDDASIQRGSPFVSRNVDLLKAVRARHPQAFVVYKPHPDVEAGFRRGRVPADEAAKHADQIVTNASILSLIEACDSVETMTSLAGFEALLRGKPVTTHGQPFYAGWGLTEDIFPVPRRGRRRSLDELVAAAMILYPRYLDPVSGLRCSPELLVERLASAGQRKKTLSELGIRALQISAARALHLGHSVRHLARRGI
jgi:capsular polysaccharide export protein